MIIIYLSECDAKHIEAVRVFAAEEQLRSIEFQGRRITVESGDHTCIEHTDADEAACIELLARVRRICRRES